VSGPRLYWPKKLGAVPGFPAELVEPLARLGLKTVGDLVARVQKHNPGMTPPAFAFGLNVRNACWFPINDPQPAKRAGEAVAAYLGYGEYGCPRDWTDPPKAKQPTPEPEPTIMPTVKLLPTGSLTLHEKAWLVPEMPKDQYATFAADVAKRGVQEPLKLIPGTKTVIDGRTRLKAATEAGLASVPVEDAVLGDDSPIVYMLRVAYLRRNLKPSQQAQLGNEIKKQLAKDMRELKKAGGKKGGQKSAEVRSGKLAVDPPQASAEKKTRAPDARTQAAALSGASPKAIDLAGKIEAKAPEVYAKMATGEIPTLAAAKKAAGLEEPKKDKPKPVKADPNEKPADLKPCPFCGSENVGVQALGLYVHCADCMSCGPSPKDPIPEESIKAWNKRTIRD